MMEREVNTIDGFNKSLDELLNFADYLKLHEKELEEKHKLQLEKQKSDYELKIQIEQRRVIHLQELNTTLTEQIERATKKQVELEQKNTVLTAKYNCYVEESKQIKDQHNEKKQRIEELERIVRILTNDKSKLDNEIKQLKLDKEMLENKIKETPPPPPPAPEPQRVSDEVLKLVEQAIAENHQLRSVLTERDNEVQKLKEQLNNKQSEDPQIVEQRLSQALNKLKNDFRIMYENQSNFFLQKVDLLKQEQRDNIASLYKH